MTILWDHVAFAALVAFSSAFAHVAYGFPDSRRLSAFVSTFVKDPGNKARRRTVELLTVAISGGVIGYFLLEPRSGPAAVTVGAMWSGAFSKLVADSREPAQARKVRKPAADQGGNNV